MVLTVKAKIYTIYILRKPIVTSEFNMIELH